MMNNPYNNQRVVEKKWDRKFKVFGMPWHLAHNYALLQMPFTEWDWLINYKRDYSDIARGDFFNQYGKDWVTHYKKGKYDVAVLHIDQNCFEPEIWERGKGQLYRELNEVITDIPKIVIMHGTPYYPEVFPDQKELIDKVKLALKDNYVIVNSYTAASQWGFGQPIIHGMSQGEWWDLPKEHRVVTTISPGGLPMYYDRDLLAAVKSQLEDEGIYHCHVMVDWKARDWDDYRNFIGRSLVYFNPTRESPMPRSRTEAMLSGACVITTPNQDADMFIENGKNGFLCRRNPAEIVQQIKWCFDNYDKTISIGQEGKKTAEKLFSWDRYAEEWYEVLCKVVDKKLTSNV